MQIRSEIFAITLVRRALAEVCTVPVLLLEMKLQNNCTFAKSVPNFVCYDH